MKLSAVKFNDKKILTVTKPTAMFYYQKQNGIE